MGGMTEWDDERVARAALTAICEPADPRVGPLLAEYGAERSLAALRRLGDETAWGRRAVALDESARVARADRLGLRFITPWDAEWPASLVALDGCERVGNMGGAPVGLWLAGPGRLPQESAGGVAVVGARASTRYGEAVATSMAAELTGKVIVSGGAYGIDAAAHRGALAAGGPTVGIYAGGLDEPYPRGNSALFERLRDEQLVVSEVAPGIRAQRAGFLARNRLIAALTCGTVVVEAAMRSGARNTANWASALGRVVMAVPGPVHSAMSAGCHVLLRDGEANLVTDADDVRALISPLGEQPELPTRGADRLFDSLDAGLLRVREAMPARRPISAGELAVACGASVPETMGALTELELLGLVRRDAEGAWRLKRPIGGAV